MTLAAWFHDLDPFAIEFGRGVGLRWYGLSYLAAFVIGWAVLKRLARRGWLMIPADRVTDAMFAIIVGTIVGGRLGYVLFYQPALLWTFSGRLPFWGVLAINEGGMASHGGLIGVVLAAFWIARRMRDDAGQRLAIPTMHVLDALALIAPFGLFLGRVANFINGELLGRIVAMPGQPAPWWAVRFPQEHLTAHAPPLSPDQQDQLADLLIESAPGQPFDTAYETLLYRIQHGADALAARLEPLVSARHPSQLYQAVAEGIVVGVLVWAVAAGPRRPGVVAAWFLIAYGVLRIATEFYRLPDAHLATPQPMGLSRGQWLSTGMIVAGAGMLVAIRRAGAPKVGGWRTRLSASEAQPAPDDAPPPRSSA